MRKPVLVSSLLAILLAGGRDAASETPKVGEGASSNSLSHEALAKEVQNPISNLIILPFENNTNLNVGPYNGVQNTLDIEPVVPFQLTEQWSLHSRTIVPIQTTPRLSPDQGPQAGLGDINPTFLFATSLTKDFLIGFGPTLVFPTATSEALGQGKWSAGPAALAVWKPGNWVVGALVNNIWSFAGDDDRAEVNQLEIEPFINYNIADGWYLTTSPIVTADWEAPADDVWTLPLGGGAGRVFRVGKLPLNATAQAYYNVVTPEDGPNWQIRLQIALLFPK